MSACVDLVLTGAAYSEREQHRTNVTVLTVLECVPHWVFSMCMGQYDLNFACIKRGSLGRGELNTVFHSTLHNGKTHWRTILFYSR